MLKGKYIYITQITQFLHNTLTWGETYVSETHHMSLASCKRIVQKLYNVCCVKDHVSMLNCLHRKTGTSKKKNERK